MKSYINLPTVLIIVIALAAFIGFGAIFDIYGDNIGVHSSAAAFSALFVILATKVLLQQEQMLQRDNEAKKDEAERKRKVFETRIELYQRSAKKIAAFLEADSVSMNSIHEIREMSMELQLVAGSQVLSSINEFATTALSELQVNLLSDSALVDSTPQSSTNVDEDVFSLSTDGRTKMWRISAQFLNACRKDLDMSEDGASNEFTALFIKLLTDFANADTKHADVIKKAREPLEGGVDEWVKIKFPRLYTPKFAAQVEKFFDDIVFGYPDLEVKVTKTLINIRNRNAKSNRKVALYFGSFKGEAYLVGFNIFASEKNAFDKVNKLLLDQGIQIFGEKQNDRLVPFGYTAAQMEALRQAVRITADLMK